MTFVPTLDFAARLVFMKPNISRKRKLTNYGQLICVFWFSVSSIFGVPVAFVPTLDVVPVLFAVSAFVLFFTVTAYAISLFFYWVGVRTLNWLLVARDFRVVGSGLSVVRTLSSRSDFGRRIDLLGRLLPRKLRAESWEPHKEDLIADYLESRQYRTRWAKRWLKFCLAVNVCLAFVDCIRVGLQSQLGKFLVSLLPPRLREWILGSGK